MRSTLLFAYGTLLSGTGRKPLDRLLRANLEPVEAGTIQGRVVMLKRYPGARPTRNHSRVSGTLLRVRNPRRVMRLIDRYEGYDREAPRSSEYVRRRVTVDLPESGHKANAWVYWYRGPRAGH